MINPDIIDLLKHGQSDEIPFMYQEIQKEDYPRDFVVFMAMMLEKYQMKRKDVAQRAGLSQDYTYKLLNGSKKTNERDYILAICIATGMSFPETQWALDIYAMPLLNSLDTRSHIIASCIRESKDIDSINDILETHNFDPIKVSPDMKSSEYKRIKQTAVPANSGIDISDFEEVSRVIEAERCGDAPMDYSYWGVLKISNGKSAYYVEAAYSEFGDHFDVLTEEMHDLYEKRAAEHNQMVETDIGFLNLTEPSDGIEVVEQYESLIEAARSPFFKWYLEIDRAVDDKILKTLNSVDDTRDSEPRFGARLGRKNWIYYMEAFNTQEPEKREYFQIIKDGDEYTYSVSHESYYMRIELDSLYEVYFKEKAHPEEYFIKVHHLPELEGNSVRYCAIFKNLLVLFHQFIHQNFDFKHEISEQTLVDDQIDSLTEMATFYMMSGDVEKAIELNESAYDLLKTAENDSLVGKIVTAYKLYTSYSGIDNQEESDRWKEECLSYKDELKARLAISNDIENLVFAPNAIGTILHFEAYKFYKSGDIENCLKLMQESVSFFEGYCYDSHTWMNYVHCLVDYSAASEAVDMDKALELLEQALSIVEENDLESDPDCHQIIYLLYNNLAWVLWNEFSNEESIIYYSKAIDLIEKHLRTDQEDSLLSRDNLEKEVERLYEIYMATSKEKEAERLKKKYAKKGITID